MGDPGPEKYVNYVKSNRFSPDSPALSLTENYIKGGLPWQYGLIDATSSITRDRAEFNSGSANLFINFTDKLGNNCEHNTCTHITAAMRLKLLGMEPFIHQETNLIRGSEKLHKNCDPNQDPESAAEFPCSTNDLKYQ